MKDNVISFVTVTTLLVCGISPERAEAGFCRNLAALVGIGSKRETPPAHVVAQNLRAAYEAIRELATQPWEKRTKMVAGKEVPDDLTIREIVNKGEVPYLREHQGERIKQAIFSVATVFSSLEDISSQKDLSPQMAQKLSALVLREIVFSDSFLGVARLVQKFRKSEEAHLAYAGGKPHYEPDLQAALMGIPFDRADAVLKKAMKTISRRMGPLTQSDGHVAEPLNSQLQTVMNMILAGEEACMLSTVLTASSLHPHFKTWIAYRETQRKMAEEIQRLVGDIQPRPEFQTSMVPRKDQAGAKEPDSLPLVEKDTTSPAADPLSIRNGSANGIVKKDPTKNSRLRELEAQSRARKDNLRGRINPNGG